MINDVYLEFSKDIARYTGKIMIRYFKQSNGSKYKQDQTIVTLADTKINTYLIEQVKLNYPDHAVDGEEEQFGKSHYVWVCDPGDGTNPYARHIPVAVFSLALVIDGISTVGGVYDPFTVNLYSAIKGEEAYQNGVRISVNNIYLDDMKSAANFDNWTESKYNIYPVVTELGKKTYFLRIGSIIRACMCVASGEFTVALFPFKWN